MTSGADIGREQTIAILRTVSYLSDLSDTVIAELAAATVEQRYDADQFIFWEGEPVFGLYIIADGIVKISRHSADGREHILHLLGEGETFNDVAALDGGPNPATASAHTESKIYAIRWVGWICIGLLILSGLFNLYFCSISTTEVSPGPPLATAPSGQATSAARSGIN